MIGFLVFLAVLVAAVYFLKLRRSNTLAGRNAAKPTYTVEPPSRRLHSPRKNVL